MKRLNKKGQTEDFLADLIPSLIIILIGLFILSNMQSANKLSTTEKGRAINDMLKFEQKTITDYLSLKIDIDNKNISTQELISLTYNNPQYQGILGNSLSRGGLAEYDTPIETIGETTPQIKPEYSASDPKECLNLVIKYPGGQTPLIIGEGCVGKEQTFYLPTFDGQYLEINSIVGKKG